MRARTQDDPLLARQTSTGISTWSSLKSQNVDLFYRLIIDHAKEMMPLVYTPTIGDVCLQYSTIYTRPEALYISIKQRKSIRTILRTGPTPTRDLRRDRRVSDSWSWRPWR